MDHLHVDIWHGELDGNPLDENYYQSFLDDSEQQFVLGLNNSAVRKRYLEVHARLRMILSHYLEQTPNTLRIAKAEHGKPYLIDFPHLSFNLSHTVNYLAIAIAENCKLGIDIEGIKPRKALSGLVDKCFSETEKCYWYSLAEHERLAFFYRFWTGKEAFVKATGSGISLGLNQCVINPETFTRFSQLPYEFQPARQWFMRGFDLTQSICGALVIKSSALHEMNQLVINSHPLDLE